MADLTEAQAGAQLAEQTRLVQTDLPIPGPDEVPAAPLLAQVPNDCRTVLVDHEALFPAPRRTAVKVDVHDADSFMQAVKQRTLPGVTPEVYADESALALVAILNDDHGSNPGWRDSRVAFALRRTPEWKRWFDNQGLMAQLDWATLIEDGQAEIREPAPARMLEIAQQFEARIDGKFRQVSRLGNGARTFEYSEEVTQSDRPADEGAPLILPEQMRLALRPFYGSTVKKDDDTFEPGAYGIDALIKFQVSQGGLKVGHKLVRPEEVDRIAFSTLVEQVEAGLDVSALRGPAPGPATPAVSRIISSGD